MLIMWSLLLLLLSVVGAEECPKLQNEMELPSCVDYCLDAKYGNACANDIPAICDVNPQLGLDAYFDKYKSCIISYCADDGDIYRFMMTFRGNCEGRRSGPLNKINGEMDIYLQFAIKNFLTSTTNAAQTSTVSLTSTPASSATPTSQNAPSSEPPATLAGRSSTSESGMPAESSQPSASSTPAQSSPSTADQSLPSAPAQPPPSSPAQNQSSFKGVDQPTSAAAAPPNNQQATPSSQPKDIVVTTTIHGTVITTHLPPPSASSTAATASPTFSTPALAGTVAGSTAGLALIIILIYILMRRRKRRQSRATSAEIWEPTRNTQPSLPKLGKPEPDSKYSSVGTTGTSGPMRQHSVGIPSPPSYPSPAQTHAVPRDPFTAPGEQTRYYNHPQRSDANLHRQASNIDSRYPSLSSPTSPVSETSTMHNWPPSGVPAPGIKLSHPDFRGDGVRSPVSELGGNGSVRKVRGAELHGAGVMSPVSELGSESRFEGSENRAAELGDDAPKGVVETEGSTIHKPYRGGISTNF